MKNLAHTLLLLLFTSSIGFAQWQVSNSQINGYAVSYPAADAAYITASTGILYKSNDGGVSWAQIYDFGPFSSLDNPNFINADTGYVEVNSNVYRTFDGGTNWTNVSLNWPQPSFVPFFQMKITDQRLYASYISNDTAYLLKSDDYGTSISKIFSHYEPNAQPFIFSFVDTLNGFLINPLELEQVLKTTNGGNSFDTIFITTGPIVLQTEFDFTDLQNGYHYGSYGSQSHPTRTWNTGSFYFPIDLDGFGVLPIHDLDFNSSKLYAASLYGKIFYSVNKGQDWVEQSTPINDLISSIAFLDESNGIAVSYGAVLYTRNGGNLGVTEPIDLQHAVEIYPNPAQNYVYVQSLSSVEIVSIDLLRLAGKQVRQFDDYVGKISLEGIPTGEYILQTSTSNGPTFTKITIR